MTFKNSRLAYGGLTLATGLALAASAASADIQHLDDVIINGGSLCVGLDCVNGESFGFDTIRLKENNLRIHFQDTSTSASFPRNQWELTANDTSNGGEERFSITDRSAGRVPFTVRGGSPSHALYVDTNGQIGMGTSNPVVELHIVDGDTPTIRLEQDGSSGFTPQTWDLAGNETNFFLRDVTNGSKLPFRVRPNAPTSSIDVKANGDVGMGTTNPTEALHVSGSDSPAILVEDTSSGFSVQMKLHNNGTPRLQFDDTSIADNIWNIGLDANSNFIWTHFDNTGVQVEITPTGDLRIDGTLTANFGNTNNTFPDYVFAPDYELMPLYEVEKFVIENRHLPRIPSADEVGKNGLNMTELQIALLEKVEELTLHTIAQQKTIDALQERLEALAD